MSDAVICIFFNTELLSFKKLASIIKVINIIIEKLRYTEKWKEEENTTDRQPLLEWLYHCLYF